MTPTIDAVGAASGGAATALRLAMLSRAGKLKPAPSRFKDARGDRVYVRQASFLPDDLFGYERLLALARRALADTAAAGAAAQVGAPVPLVLAIPEAGRPDEDPRLGHQVLRELAHESPIPIDVAASGVVRAGHAGGAFAMQAALRLLGAGAGRPAVLVGGVDSYHHPEVIAWLDAERRLHRRREGDGILPGEGAAFALLRRQGRGGERGEILLRGVEVGREEALEQGQPNLGAAMTRLARGAAAASGRPIDWVITDVNGEHHRIAEWTKVRLRVDELRGVRHDELAREIGDTGAASGALFLAAAVSLWRAGCAPGEALLMALHAEGPERGALLLERTS